MDDTPSYTTLRFELEIQLANAMLRGEPLDRRIQMAETFVVEARARRIRLEKLASPNERSLAHARQSERDAEAVLEQLRAQGKRHRSSSPSR